jgi:hypothetical protein
MHRRAFGLEKVSHQKSFATIAKEDVESLFASRGILKDISSSSINSTEIMSKIG